MSASRFPWLLVLLVALSVAALEACSSGSAPDDGVRPPARPSQDTPTVTKVVTASVLITEDIGEAPISIERIDAAPASVVVDIGEDVAMTARAFGPGSRLIDDVDFVWSLRDPRAGRVTRDGSFRAGSTPGTYEAALTVTGVLNTPSGIRHATAGVTVTVIGETVIPRLATVAVFPDSPVVLSGQIFRMWAVGFDESGLVIPGVSVAWRVNDSALGRINDIGYLTVEGNPGLVEGAVTVTVIWEGIRVSETMDVQVIESLEADDFLTVQILPQRFHMDKGDRLQLRAIALNGLGELVTGTELRWNIATGQAGVISGTGLFVAGEEPGVYTEAITVEAIVPGERGFIRAADYASVVIREERSSRRLEAARVSPESVTVRPGSRVLLTAFGIDELGQPAENIIAVWETQSDDVGTIDELGSFIAGDKPGRYNGGLRAVIHQRLGDEFLTRSATVDVIITGILTEAETRPALATISPGKAVHFSVNGVDGNGVALPGLVVFWSVTDKSIGSIDAFGNFIASDAPGIYSDVVQAEVVQVLPESN